MIIVFVIPYQGEKDGTSGIRNSVQRDGISHSATVKLNKEDAPGSSSSGEVRSTGKKAAPLLGGPGLTFLYSRRMGQLVLGFLSSQLYSAKKVAIDRVR